MAWAAAQGALPSLSNSGPGGAMSALTNAIGAVANQNASLTQQALLAARLTTATGSDVDLFVADFAAAGFTGRLPASFATGQVTFTVSPGFVPLIVPGASVKTADGSVAFTVQQDTTNPFWSASQGGYLVTASSITVPVIATTAGSVGNVQAGTITTISSSIASVSGVTNAAPFSNGIDGETDKALKLRFAQWLNTRSEATEDAISYAINSVAPGITYSIEEDVGSFTIWVGNGSGSVPSSTIATIQSAVASKRALGINYAVCPAINVPVTVSMTIEAKPTYDVTTLVAPVYNAVLSYIQQLGVGNVLDASNLYATALSIEGVLRVESLLINGADFDVGGAANSIIYCAPGACVVNY